MSWLIKTKPGCKYCDLAKELLAQAGICATEINHDTSEKIEAFKAEGYRTFPQVFHNGTLIGGYSELLHHMAPEDEDAF